MKKKLWILLALVLGLFYIGPVFAEAQLDHVTDAAGLLSDEEWEELEGKAEELSEEYECGIYVIAVDDFTQYVDTDNIQTAAEVFYSEYELGYGNEHDGVLLVLSMNERDYCLIAYGYGNTAFTDYGKDLLAEEFLDDFKNNDWAQGFEDFIEESGRYLQLARSGTPVDIGKDPKAKGMESVLSFLLALLLSLLICFGLKSKMKSVRKGSEAAKYIGNGGIDISLRQDMYTHTTTTRTKIEKNNSSGGTSVNSRGFSGKSGKF